MVPRNVESDEHLTVAFTSLEGLGDHVNAVVFSRAVSFRYWVTIEALPKDYLEILRA